MDSGSSALQREVTFQLMRGERIFLSGAAGTGKTYFVKALVRNFLKNGKYVVLTASTGIAATQLADDVANGVAAFQRPATTLHSAAMLPFSSDPDVPKDCVISQDPKAFSKVKRYRRIYVTVSEGPRLYSVPDVSSSGISLRQASLEIKQSGLEVGTVQHRPSYEIERDVVEHGTVANRLGDTR